MRDNMPTIQSTAPSRRALFGTSAAVLAAAVLPASAGAAPLDNDNDAELIRISHYFAECAIRYWYQLCASEDEEIEPDAPDTSILDRIAAMPAATPAGWQAKALAFAAYYNETYDGSGMPMRPPPLLVSLLRDTAAHQRSRIVDRCRAEFGPLGEGYSDDARWIGYSPERMAQIKAEAEEQSRQLEAKKAAERRASQKPPTRESAEKRLKAASTFREIADELYQDAVKRMAAFEVAA
jgi:hypothetical protein